MIGKPIALLQVPNQRRFSVDAACRYLDCDRKTLYKWIESGKLKALDLDGRRCFRLEDLDSFIDSLPSWEHNPSAQDSASSRKETA